MKCAVYCRLSREDEREGISESIINQQNMLCDYANKNGWQIFDIYCDEDYSGTDLSRPAFGRLIEGCRQHKFDIVLCKSLSRFARDMETCEKYIHNAFERWQIRFIAVADNIDTGISGGKKARQITGLVNEWYLEDLSESIRAVLNYKRKQGFHIGSFALYGYIKDENNKGHIKIDNEAAEVVRQIFNMRINGLGKQAIATALNKAGIPNPTRYKQLCGLAYSNGAQKNTLGLWSKSTVGRILNNQMYIGTMVQGVRKKAGFKSKKLLTVAPECQIIVPDTHPPIIEREVFELAAQKSALRRSGGSSGKVHPLAGKIFCFDCKSAMIKTSGSGSGAKTYLHCSLNARSGNLCSRHGIRLDILCEKVQAELNKSINTFISQNERQSILSLMLKNKNQNNNTARLQQINMRIEQKNAALAAAYGDKAAGILSGEQFEAVFKIINTELCVLKKQQAECEKTHSACQSNCYTAIPQSIELSRLAAEIFIEKAEVRQKTSENKICVDIYWKF